MNDDDDFKCGYRSANGHQSKAYVDGKADENGVHRATNKHSDMPLLLKWVDIENEWVEVVTPEMQAEQEAWMKREFGPGYY